MSPAVCESALHGHVGAELGGVGQPGGHHVDGHDHRAGEQPQVLDGVAAEAAGADHDGGAAGVDAAQGPAHCVVAGGPGVGERTGQPPGSSPFSRTSSRVLCTSMYAGQAAVHPVAPSGEGVGAVVVLAPDAPAAVAARDAGR